MSIFHIRNVITILLVLTLANLAAMVAALHALHEVRNDAIVRVAKMDRAIHELSALSARLCATQPAVCNGLPRWPA